MVMAPQNPIILSDSKYKQKGISCRGKPEQAERFQHNTYSIEI